MVNLRTDDTISIENPVAISDLLVHLDVFRNKDVREPWGWFVHTAHKISAQDFLKLTRGKQI